MQGDTAAAQAKRAGGRKTVQNDGRRCGDRSRKTVAIRWYTSGLHSCGSTFIRTKQLSKGWIFRIHPFLFLYSI